MQELPTEEKEGYLTRAILLMNNQPMVSIMMVMDVFLLRLLISGGGGGCQQRQAVNRSRHPRPSHANIEHPIPVSYSRSPVYNVAMLIVETSPLPTHRLGRHVRLTSAHCRAILGSSEIKWKKLSMVNGR